ncbi:MAG: peptidoglycan-binding protein [Firmicutes bacterium]|nr:peptidoglycan-binding protein [Bacillota bacterium]
MRTLQEGDRGSTAELLQWGLGRAGVPLAADGIFGPLTAKAVRDWQAQSGLAADGAAGPKTWASLYPYLTGIRLHSVRGGDTFPALAARYGTTAQAIAVANPLALPERLAPGQTLRIPMNLPAVPTDIRWSSGLLALVVEGLRGRYPFLGVSAVGNSVLGRPLWQLTIGRGSLRVGYNAAHHANEWITTPVLLRFLEQFAAGVAFGSVVDFRGLSERYTLDIVPMVNPDGVGLA